MSKATKFSREVEEYAVEQEVSYLEALATKMDEKGIEYKKVTAYLSKSLFEKIQREAEERNILTGTNRLPFEDT